MEEIVIAAMTLMLGCIAFVTNKRAARIRDLELQLRKMRDTDDLRKMMWTDFVTKGPVKLSEWFGRSSASFACLPRVLMEDMSNEWQADMAKLLRQLDAEFPGSPLTKSDMDLQVQAKVKGKFTRLPDALTDYRNPKNHVLQAWRQG